MEKNIELLDNRYNVFATPVAKSQMELYAQLCDDEIGWMCSVTEYKNRNFVIEKCYLLKQETNSATTEIDPESLLELWKELSEEEQAKLKGWGHSHVNMAPSPSSQDEAQMDDFKDQNNWFIRIINNKKDEWKIHVFDYERGIKIELDQLRIYYPELQSLKADIEAEIKEKVSQKTYTAPRLTTRNPYYSSHQYSGYSHQHNQQDSLLNNKKEIDKIFDTIELKIKYIDKIEDAYNYPDYFFSIH